MRKMCFFIAPIGSPNSSIRRRSDRVLDLLIRPTLERLGYRVIRLDRLVLVGSLSIQIRALLRQADLVIADLTGANANVFYELGFRHATDKPCLQLIEEGERIPFDVSDIRTLFVNSTTDSQLQSASSILADHVRVAQNFSAGPLRPPSAEEIAAYFAGPSESADNTHAAILAQSTQTAAEHVHPSQGIQSEENRDGNEYDRNQELKPDVITPLCIPRDRENLARRWRLWTAAAA